MKPNYLKHIILSALLLLSYVAAHADNLSIEPFSLSAGDTYDVDVNLTNSQPFSAFQTELTLPEGIELHTGSGEPITLSERASDDHSLKVNTTSGNVTKIISFSNGNSPFSGDSGTLFTIRIIATGNFNGGNITLSNTIFSNASNQDVIFDNTSAFIGRITLATSVRLSESAVELKYSEAVQLTAEILPENATDKTISWSVADESIATVDQNGLVTAHAAGTTTVRATTASGVYADCLITVKEESGIEDILSDKSASVRIFNLQGIEIYSGAYSEAHLKPDCYIVVYSGKSIKVKIK